MEAPRKKAAETYPWTACSGMSNLPRHVLMEILCRLPIKTLIYCKSVCKSWLNLISTDSEFAKLHLQRSPSELLFHSFRSYCAPIRFYLGNIQFDYDSAPNLKLNPLFDFPRVSVTSSNFTDASLCFVNSCNGLVCFRSSNKNHFAVICNPIMGDFIIIPPPGSGELMPIIVGFGLGFSGKANRYKLLHIMKPNILLGKSSKQFAEICTFEKGSSWRNVGDFPYTNPDWPLSKPVFLEGKLHLHCLVSHSPEITTISCFDFDNELFEELPLPPGHFNCSRMTIGILGGRLFLSDFRYGSNNCIDIWVMKEYGVKDSWTKAFTPSNNDPRIFNIGGLTPIQHLDTGEILMLYLRNHLVLHNPVANSFRTVGTIQLLNINAYSPTLLLLKDALMGYDTPVCNVNLRSWIMCKSHLSNKFLRPLLQMMLQLLEKRDMGMLVPHLNFQCRSHKKHS